MAFIVHAPVVKEDLDIDCAGRLEAELRGALSLDVLNSLKHGIRCLSL